jgi:hypothetical protein
MMAENMNGKSLLPATGTGNGLFINITIDEGVDGSPNGCKRYTQRVKKMAIISQKDAVPAAG